VRDARLARRGRPFPRLQRRAEPPAAGLSLGDAQEIDWILRRLRERNGGEPLFAAGVSLGGNALLKWLGESGATQPEVERAAAVSAPLDLMISGDALGKGFNLIYAGTFCDPQGEGRGKARVHPGLHRCRTSACGADAARLRRRRHRAAARLRDTDDYWTRAAASRA
jgi:alpha-beta hydrolase superfamily lysophospholipase